MADIIGTENICVFCGYQFKCESDAFVCPKCNSSYLKWKPVISCSCGEELCLHDPMTNNCKCGKSYNGSGQELSPRRFWGEETGERF